MINALNSIERFTDDELSLIHILYVAKVQNIVQNIGAAFLEIEPGVNCYFDLRDAQNAFFTHKIVTLCFPSAAKASLFHEVRQELRTFQQELLR